MHSKCIDIGCESLAQKGENMDTMRGVVIDNKADISSSSHIMHGRVGKKVY